MTKQSYPVYVGWYQPHDRSTDFTNEVPDPKTGELVVQPSMTKQGHMAECDINNIIRDFSISGQVAHMQTQQARYIDLPDSLDYQESLNLVKAAETAFASLPSAVRSRFGNDAAKFLEFTQDPANGREMVEMGLASPKPYVDPTAPPVSPPPQALDPPEPPKKGS